MAARSLVALLPLLFVACTGGTSESLEDPFAGENEQELRSEECPARLTIDVHAVAIPSDERLVQDLARAERAKGAANPTESANAQLDVVRPWLASARTNASVSLLGASTRSCSYRTFDPRTDAPTEHHFRMVRTRPANGGEATLVLRLRAPTGRANAVLWYELPLESVNARSIVVDTRRTPMVFAQSADATIALGTFEATARVVP